MDKDKLIYALDKVIEWSLYILIFSIPFSKTMIELCITVAFFGWISKKILIKDFRLKKTPLNMLLLAFFIVNVISFVNADFKLLFMRSIISKCLKFIILYFVVVETIDSKTKLKNLLKMGLISASIVMIDAYIQRYLTHYDLFRLYPSFKYAPLTDPGLHPGLPTGPFPFPNDLSAWMLIMLMPVLALFAWGVKELRARFILGGFLFPFAFLFYLANTRSAWLGFFTAFFLILLIYAKKLFIICLILVLVAATVIFILPKEKTVDILDFSSLQDRGYMWRISWKVFTEHPVIGNGLNMFFSKFKEYRTDMYKNERGSYAHNGFLQIAAEIGALGLLVFLWLLGTAFRSAFLYIRKSNDLFYKTFALGLSGGIFAFLVHSFFDTNLQSLPLVSLFWFSLALLMSLPYVHGQKI